MKSFYNTTKNCLEYYPHSFVYDLKEAQDYTDKLRLMSGDSRSTFLQPVYLPITD